MEDRLVQLLQDAIERLDDPSGRERLGVYNRVRKALVDHLDRLDPPITVRERVSQIRNVERSIRRIEANYRALAAEEKKRAASRSAASAAGGAAHRGVDDGRMPARPRGPAGGQGPAPADALVPSPGGERPATRRPDWRRVGVDRFQPSDRNGRRSRPRQAEPMTVYHLPTTARDAGLHPSATASLVSQIEDHLTKLSLRVRILGLLLRRHTQEAIIHDRLHMLWMVVEPMVQVGLIVVIYWFMQKTYVLDMPAFSFAVVGIGGWLMFRTVVRVLSGGAGREAPLMYFPVITRFDIILSRAVFTGILYLLISALILWIVWVLDFGTGAEDIMGFLGWWFVLWIFAVGFGLANMAFIDTYPAMRKFTPLVMRKLIFFSGVVLVTEQLPSDYKIYFLWNPVIHAAQLMRSSLFVEYNTEDASPTYLLICALVFLIFGLAAERSNRKKVPRL